MKTKLFLIAAALFISSIVIAGSTNKGSGGNGDVTMENPPHHMFPFLPDKYIDNDPFD